ncbi:MAG: prepilin-type N-terminal cleavage/methylation domain-containing protein [Phycisphaerales bacterium]|nr:prepilin-type N-terminal cleavage/methylation domain-containing protein [Phycisphaerales bacterium]
MIRRGFTLTELMVGVLVLVIVIASVGKMFGQFSRAASLGQANSSVLQQAVAIERRIRDDMAGLTRTGPMALRCVDVRNDINRLLSGAMGGSASAPLLDPTQPPEARLRIDQLVFFTTARQTSQRFAGSYDVAQGGIDAFANHGSTLSRVYLGPGVQMLNDPGALPGGTMGGDRPSYDPEAFDWGMVMPWSYDASPGDLDIRRWPQATVVGQKIDGTQPSANRWVLARQAALCTDDMGRPDYYSSVADETAGALDPNARNSAVIWSDRNLWNGRVDICAESPQELSEYWFASGVAPAFRRLLGADISGTNPSLANMASLIELRYPRAERTAPTADGQDQMLSAITLAPNCSSFEIDWTWADSTGAQLDRTTSPTSYKVVEFDTDGDGTINANEIFPLRGFAQNPYDPDAANFGLSPRISVHRAQAWFGLPAYSILPTGQPVDADPTSTKSPPDHGVRTLGTADIDGTPASSVYGLTGPGLGTVFRPMLPATMEGYNELRRPDAGGTSVAVVRIYCVLFGFNSDSPSATAANGTLQFSPTPFTPFPSALRISMRLHDPAGRIPDGQSYQFVVDLPRGEQ